MSRTRLLRVTLDNVIGCDNNAKTSADRSALELAKVEHERVASSLTRQREGILPDCLDREQEIAALKTTLKERELYLAVLHDRQRFKDEGISLAIYKRKSFLKGFPPLLRIVWSRPYTRVDPPSNLLTRCLRPRPHPCLNPPFKPLPCSLRPRPDPRFDPPLHPLLCRLRPWVHSGLAPSLKLLFHSPRPRLQTTPH